MYQGKRIAAVVLARARASRLKDKMTLPFAGHKTVVEAVIARVQVSALIDDIIFATSDSPSDDIFVSIAERAGVTLVRGSEDDVVARMQATIAALETRPDAIARVCSDNPLLMPTLIDDALRQLIDADLDVVTPFEQNSYPFGFSLVTLTTDCLAQIDSQATDGIYREHVENFCFDHPDRFAIGYQEAPPDLAAPELCLTLDYAVDYDRLNRYAEILKDIPVAEQPAAAIAALNTVRITLVDLPQSVLGDITADGDPDLIICAHARSDLSAALGVVWPAEVAGEVRALLCRLGDDAPFVVHRADALPNEDGAAFLERVLPMAIRHLRAGPPRALAARHRSGEKMLK